MPRSRGKARDAKSTYAKSAGTGGVKGPVTTLVKAASRSKAPPRQWPLLVALASAMGLLLGAAVMVLSLWSVATEFRGPSTAATPVAASRATPAPTLGAGQIATNPGQPTPANIAAATSLDRRTKGNPNAPVVISEWFDFQCPACGRYALTREPDLERQYIDTGKVRYVARHFAFLGPESFLAAEASLAAAEQGRYWDYRKLLFQNQKGENLGAFNVDNLKRFAAELGLDQATFNARLDQGTYRDSVLSEAKEAQSLGVNATPTFFINSQKIQGVPTVEQLGQLIDEEIAKSR